MWLALGQSEAPPVVPAGGCWEWSESGDSLCAGTGRWPRDPALCHLVALGS